MVQADRRDHRYIRCYQVRRIKPPAKADLNNLDICIHRSELDEGHRSQQLEHTDDPDIAALLDRLNVRP